MGTQRKNKLLWVVALVLVALIGSAMLLTVPAQAKASDATTKNEYLVNNGIYDRYTNYDNPNGLDIFEYATEHYVYLICYKEHVGYLATVFFFYL